MNPMEFNIDSVTFDSARLSHAYIVPSEQAYALAMAVVCSSDGQVPCMSCSHCSKSSRGIHPDISILSKAEDKRDIAVDQIRELRRDAIIVPNDSDKKAYIISGADNMNAASQNAFLRILEEPPSHAVFILQTDVPDGLLLTVRSRCVEIKANATPEAADEEISETAEEFIAAIRGGNLSLTLFTFRLDKLDRQQFASFLNAARERVSLEIQSASRDATESSEGLQGLGYTQNAEGSASFRIKESSEVSINPESSASNIIDTLSRAERVLLEASEYLKLNVNVGHISGMILASLINTDET